MPHRVSTLMFAVTTCGAWTMRHACDAKKLSRGTRCRRRQIRQVRQVRCCCCGERAKTLGAETGSRLPPLACTTSLPRSSIGIPLRRKRLPCAMRNTCHCRAWSSRQKVRLTKIKTARDCCHLYTSTSLAAVQICDKSSASCTY